MENIQMLLKQGAVGKPCEAIVKVGDKVKVAGEEFTVIDLWQNDIAVIENDAHRYTIRKDKLKKI